MQSLIKFIITIFFIILAANGQTNNDNKNNHKLDWDPNILKKIKEMKPFWKKI